VFRILLSLAAISLVAVALISAPDETIRYTDIAPKSHLTYVTNNDLSPRKYFAQTICGGVAIFDFDGDGKMDIFFTNGAKLPELRKTNPSFYNCLLRNKGDGTFEDVTAKAGLLGAALGYNVGVAAGDFDNDGKTDLFICGAGRNALYHNEGNGHFKDITAASGITAPADTLGVGAAWFDYDNDGLLDLVVSNYTIWSPAKDKRCTIGGVEYYCDPQAYYENVPPRLYHNLGAGKFEDVTEKSGFGKTPGKGMGISIADFNNDGFEDVFIANDTEPNSLFINKGDGTFEESAVPLGVAYDENGKTVSSMGSDAADFNNDGLPDIVYNDLLGQTWQIFTNQGDFFRFVSPQSHMKQLSLPFSGWGLGFVDYDNDGWKDLYGANGDVDNVLPNAKEHDTMFRNVDGKTFEDVSDRLGADFQRPGFQRGSAFGDLNNDGFPDIVVTTLGQTPRILINSGSNHHHWITLDLVGHRSNRDAIGATVKVTTASGRVIYNHVAPSVGFISTSDKRLHVGLNDETAVKSIVIRWPRGIVQTVENPALDRVTRIDEPSATQ